MCAKQSSGKRSKLISLILIDDHKLWHNEIKYVAYKTKNDVIIVALYLKVLYLMHF